MTRPTQFLAATLAAFLALTAPAAACLVEYKAKRDEPYGLDRGVMEIPDASCNPEAAAGIVAERLAAEGWTLLSIVSVKGADGESDAGN